MSVEGDIIRTNKPLSFITIYQNFNLARVEISSCDTGWRARYRISRLTNQQAPLRIEDHSVRVVCRLAKRSEFSICAEAHDAIVGLVSEVNVSGGVFRRSFGESERGGYLHSLTERRWADQK